jgi:hypothetical protein
VLICIDVWLGISSPAVCQIANCLPSCAVFVYPPFASPWCLHFLFPWKTCCSASVCRDFAAQQQLQQQAPEPIALLEELDQAPAMDFSSNAFVGQGVESGEQKEKGRDKEKKDKKHKKHHKKEKKHHKKGEPAHYF